MKRSCPVLTLSLSEASKKYGVPVICLHKAYLQKRIAGKINKGVLFLVSQDIEKYLSEFCDKETNKGKSRKTKLELQKQKIKETLCFLQKQKYENISTPIFVDGIFYASMYKASCYCNVTQRHLENIVKRYNGAPVILKQKRILVVSLKWLRKNLEWLEKEEMT